MECKLAIVMITNGIGGNLLKSLAFWSSQFTFGFDLFISGPEDILRNCAIPSCAIINYKDKDEEYPFFEINKKKYLGGIHVKAEYIYFVHDRFYPKEDFRQTITIILNNYKPDFGAADVFNEDGSLSIVELRIKKEVLQLSLVDALLSSGRIICTNESTSHVAVNGGQFFLKSNLLHLLQRPLRWLEMEDDILSFDLIPYNGIWIHSTSLFTLVHRAPPKINKYQMIKTKVIYCIYILGCNIIMSCLKKFIKSYPVLSVGQQPTTKMIYESLDSGGCNLIDPFHKMTATSFIPLTVEKFISLCRICSNGTSPTKLHKTNYGWFVGL